MVSSRSRLDSGAEASSCFLDVGHLPTLSSVSLGSHFIPLIQDLLDLQTAPPPRFSQSFHLSFSPCVTSLEQLLRFLHKVCLFSVTAAIFICSDVISSAAEIAALSFEFYQKYQGILWRCDKENTVRVTLEG